MTSSTPQGLVPGHLVFVIYVNDFDVDVGGVIGKFSADTRIGRFVDSVESSLRVQDYNGVVEMGSEIADFV